MMVAGRPATVLHRGSWECSLVRSPKATINYQIEPRHDCAKAATRNQNLLAETGLAVPVRVVRRSVDSRDRPGGPETRSAPRFRTIAGRGIGIHPAHGAAGAAGTCRARRPRARRAAWLAGPRRACERTA